VRRFGIGAGRGRVQEFVLFMISSALFQASRLGVNLVAASLLAPATFGLWGLFVVSQTYTTYGSLGLISGANRRIPLLLGSGAAAQVAEVERTVLAGAVGAGALLAIGGAVVGPALGGPWQDRGNPARPGSVHAAAVPPSARSSCAAISSSIGQAASNSSWPWPSRSWAFRRSSGGE